MFNEFKNKNVVITGHTGFKGSWLTAWMCEMGANVTGIGLEPVDRISNFNVCALANKITDLRINVKNSSQIKEAIENAKPDFIFHLAAQALVKESYDDPINTWETNVIGTVNVLNSLRDLKKKCVAIMITSDKCYDNVEWIWGYRETDKLGGPDPYSASKGGAELAIQSFYRSYFRESKTIKVASVRAGNVIGGGDWSVNRIIPDCVKAWANNEEVLLRNPFSTRPWQHVLDPLSGYIKLAYDLSNNNSLNGESFNFGPPPNQNFNVMELVNEMSAHWDKVSWKDISEKNSGPYESGLLKLDCDKAMQSINWKAALNFQDTVRLTAEWYKLYYENPESALENTMNQIKFYQTLRSDWDV